MATASTLSLTTAHKGSFSTPPLSEASAQKATDLLQRNHEQHHMYFNSSGFHNHLAHHMFALYALGAPPEILQKHYDANSSYQKGRKPVHSPGAQDLDDPAKFKQFLFKRDHYPDYLEHFRREVDKLGWQAALQKYLFAGDERANDMLDRMWAGILHPIIHVGYGVEWAQPAVIAEGLAMCATHDEYLGRFFPAARERATAAGPSQRTLAALLSEAATTPALRDSVTPADDLRMRDGVLGRARAPMVDLAAQWTVGPGEVEAKLAELCSASAYVLAAAQHPRHPPRLDFFFLHCMNSLPMVAALVRSDALAPAQRADVLERSGRFLLLTYVGQHCTALHPERVRGYSSLGAETDWDGVARRVMAAQDDSHAIKCVRALRFAEQLCAGRQGDGFPMAPADWLQAGNMLADLVESGRERYISPSGWDKPWDEAY